MEDRERLSEEKGDGYDFSHVTPVQASKTSFIRTIVRVLYSPYSIGVVFLVFAIFFSFFFYHSYARSLLLSFTQLTQSPAAATQVVVSPTQAAPLVVTKPRFTTIGFLPSWTVAQQVPVEISGFDQLIYFGLGVNDNGELIRYGEDKNPTLEWHYFTADYFTNLKSRARAKNTKVLIAIKNFDNTSIDTLISNEQATKRFSDSLLTLITKYDLDGVNLDFEYFTDSTFPTVRYLNRFLETVITTLKKANPRYIVSIDVNASVIIHDAAYDMAKIGELVDQVIVMAYDYRTVQSSRAGSVSPLYAPGNEDSIDKSIQSLKGRVPFEKVVLAVPLYGYEWQTAGTSFGSPTLNNSGALATLRRVGQLIASRDDVVVNWDETSQTPWLVYTQSGAIKQIYFENSQSITEKVAYMQAHNLNGIAFWALGYEEQDSEVWKVISALRE